MKSRGAADAQASGEQDVGEATGTATSSRAMPEKSSGRRPAV